MHEYKNSPIIIFEKSLNNIDITDNEKCEYETYYLILIHI